MGYAILYGLLFAQMALFVVTYLASARIFGIRIMNVSVGYPAVIPITPRVKVGPIPGASVEIYGLAGPIEDPIGWRNRPLGTRLFVVLAPWLVTFAVALLCLGFDHGTRSFVHGFRQVLVVNPIPLVKRMAAIAAHAPLATTIGIALAKVTAANMLPFGGLAGGAVLRELATKPKQPTPRALEVYFAASMIALLVWTVVRIVFF